MSFIAFKQKGIDLPCELLHDRKGVQMEILSLGSVFVKSVQLQINVLTNKKVPNFVQLLKCMIPYKEVFSNTYAVEVFCGD